MVSLLCVADEGGLSSVTGASAPSEKHEGSDEKTISRKASSILIPQAGRTASSNPIMPPAPPGSEVFAGALTRLRASAQLETVTVIGTRCARCRRVLAEDDFFLEVAGVSIHWDCLQCNECGRVFGDTVGGKTKKAAEDNCVLLQPGGRGVSCANCGDFRNFFPSCARCMGPVTEADWCVAAPAGTTYWHPKCFSCARCAEPLLFADEDALWHIDPETGMPVCFFHSNALDSTPPLQVPHPSSTPTECSVPSPPPPSMASNISPSESFNESSTHSMQESPQFSGAPLQPSPPGDLSAQSSNLATSEMPPYTSEDLTPRSRSGSLKCGGCGGSIEQGDSLLVGGNFINLWLIIY